MKRRSWFAALVGPLVARLAAKPELKPGDIVSLNVRYAGQGEADLAELRGINADLERINAYLWNHIKQDQALIYKLQEALWGFQPPRLHPQYFVIRSEPTGEIEWSELQDPTTWS